MGVENLSMIITKILFLNYKKVKKRYQRFGEILTCDLGTWGNFEQQIWKKISHGQITKKHCNFE